jgi:hypothetical protein
LQILIQNRAARVLTGSSYDVSSKDVLSQLKWQTLEEPRDNKKAFFMLKKPGKTSEYPAIEV